jgi:phage-related protein
MTSLGQTGATGFAAGFKKVAGPAIAAAIAVAGVALVRFGKDAIIAAEQARQASQRVDSIAKSMGIFGDQALEVSGRIQNFAEEQEKLIAVDADVIKGAQAKLLTFKELARSADESGGAFDRATLAAVDLAAAGFGTAETNAVQLGKALNDPVKGITALTRSGITFTAAEKEKIKALVESGDLLTAQDLVLKAIETQVGGTAAATALSSEKIRLGFEAVKDSIGNLLLPAFDSVATVLSEKVFPAVQGFFDSIKENGIGPALTELFTNFTSLRQSFMDSILQALPGIIDAIIAFIPTLVQSTVTMITSVVSAITNALPQIVQGAIQLFQGIIEGLTQALPVIIEALTAAIPQILRALVDALPQLIESALTLFTGIVQGLVKALPEIIDAVIDAMPEIIKAIIDAIPLFIEAGIEIVKGLAKGIVENAPAIVGAAIEGVADLVISTFKKILGIKSPSKVFAEFGKNTMQGYAKGVKDAFPYTAEQLNKAFAGLAQTNFADSRVGKFYKLGRKLMDDLNRGLRAGALDLDKIFTQVLEDATEGMREGKRKDVVTRSIQRAIKAARPLLEELEQAYNFVTNKILDAQNVLANKVKEKLDYVSGLIEKFGGTLSLSKTSTIRSVFKDLTKRITETKELRQLTDQLLNLGLNKKTYREIVESGSVGFARSLLAGGSSAVEQLNQLTSEADKQAAMLAETVGSVFFDQGIEMAKGVVAGLQAERETIFGLFSDAAAKLGYDVSRNPLFALDQLQTDQMRDAIALGQVPFKGTRPGPDGEGTMPGQISKNGKWAWDDNRKEWYWLSDAKLPTDQTLDEWLQGPPGITDQRKMAQERLEYYKNWLAEQEAEEAKRRAANPQWYTDTMSGGTINYYAAPNQSIGSEAALFQAIKRAKVVAQW